jgi:hypothetical protein
MDMPSIPDIVDSIDAFNDIDIVPSDVPHLQLGDAVKRALVKMGATNTPPIQIIITDVKDASRSGIFCVAARWGVADGPIDATVTIKTSSLGTRAGTRAFCIELVDQVYTEIGGQYTDE